MLDWYLSIVFRNQKHEIASLTISLSTLSFGCRLAADTPFSTGEVVKTDTIVSIVIFLIVFNFSKFTLPLLVINFN